MRKAMNMAIAEALERGVPAATEEEGGSGGGGGSKKPCVYLGEDVEHGGYYLVTDGLKDRFPLQVRDFPPDETSLVGAAMGFAHAGLLPICEIPYAKYLDCGADMFFEAAIAHWLSNGAQTNGMVVRLQGFDKGVFGGNFHTHNSLHMPPGVDVVCYSNGFDYAAGMRYALQQAAAGRMVMSVDSTALLNQRHLHDNGDDGWLCSYPQLDDGGSGEVFPFDEIRLYPAGGAAGAPSGARVAVVTYGNGVPTALQAAAELGASGMDGAEGGGEGMDVDVIDCPYLGGPLGVPAGLVKALTDQGRCRYDGLVFADVCKEGQQPLASTVLRLHALPTAEAGGDESTATWSALPSDGRWCSVAAQPTYNPLGTTTTFLSKDDIAQACRAVGA